MKNKLRLIILSVLVIFAACSSEEKTIGLKDNIRHDDFVYQVDKVEKTTMIEGKKAGGMFYIITFKCRNEAKKVEHKWDNSIAYIIDENGKEYENITELQKLLNTAQPYGYLESYNTKAGASDSTVFVFDVPIEVKQPHLKVRGDFLMGDIFDRSQFKNTKVKLY